MGIVPIATWLRTYTPQLARQDLLAGLTVGVMLVPQGMAYALVAGLPPIYGLYAGLTPLVVYSLMGTSRHLAVGPVAMVSLLVATSVAPLAGGDPERYLALAILLSVMTGVLQLVLGAIRTGFLTSFLSHPVLTGFTGAAAIIIGASQVRHITGISPEGGDEALRILLQTGARLAEVDPLTAGFGVGGVVTLVLIRRLDRRLPGALVVVIAGTLLSWIAIGAGSLEIVGHIPAGLPSPSVPYISLADARALIPATLTISLVGFMESIAIAKSMGHRRGYRVDANAELRALGLANLVGGFFQAFPTTGGLSRTAVNEQAGARTQMAGLVAAAVIAIVLLVLTPAFHYLPKAILGAIILVAVAGLFDHREFRRLWHVSRPDFGLAAVTLLVTLFWSVEGGILTGVLASLALLVHQSSRPHTAVLGRLPGTTTYRNVLRNPEAVTRDDTLVYRVDASLYFANIEFVTDQVLALAGSSSGIRRVVLDFYSVNRIDSTAAHGLQELVDALRERGIATVIAGLKGPVRDVLIRTGHLDGHAAAGLYDSVHGAVEAGIPDIQTSDRGDE